MKSGEIADILEKYAPADYACDWDNVGMHVGRKDNEVHKIVLTVDIDENAIELAIKEKAQMIVSHHPLIFHGIRQINEDSFMGERILKLMEHNINAYCMHTNFDSTHMAVEAGKMLGIKNMQVIEELKDGYGIGVTGDIAKNLTMASLCERIKSVYNLESLTCYGHKDFPVRKIAIVPGSGKDYIDDAIKLKAQVLLTGDVTYHYGIDAAAKGLNIIDAGHFGLEKIFMDIVEKYIKNQGMDVTIIKNKASNVFYL